MCNWDGVRKVLNLDEILRPESVIIFKVGPDRSSNQGKLSHAIIYHDNIQKPFTLMISNVQYSVGKD